MSTNASISKINEDGSIKSVYLHWDGYISGAGITLKTSYNTEELVNNLLSFGDISVLNQNTDNSVFYDREYNEKNVEARNYSYFLEYTLEEHQEYMYLFADGKWMVNTKIKPRKFEDFQTL